MHKGYALLGERSSSLPQPWYRKASVQTALVSGVFLTIVAVIVECSPKGRLEQENRRLVNDVQRLETQLAPFRAIAIERFGQNEEEALAKLAAQVEELQTEMLRAAGVIRRFDVEIVASLTGNWQSDEPPDLTKLFRKAGRGSDVRIELETNNGVMRWLELQNSRGPRIARGEGGSWVLDYTVEAPTGSWILGTHRDDLKNCGGLELTLYGIDCEVSKDSVVSVVNVTLSLLVNGIPAGTSA